MHRSTYSQKLDKYEQWQNRIEIRTGQIRSKNENRSQKNSHFGMEYIRLDAKRYKFEEKRATEIRKNKQRKINKKV